MALQTRRIAFRWIFLGALAAAGVLAADCTTQITLGDVGTTCTTDDQCKVPLACKCVVMLAGDDEGTDEVLQNGTCQVTTYICPKDGGVTDAPIVQDAGSEASVVDAGAPEADATTTEASGDATADVTVDATPTDAGTDATAEIAVDAPTTSDAGETGEAATDAGAASEVSPDAVDVDAHD